MIPRLTRALTVLALGGLAASAAPMASLTTEDPPHGAGAIVPFDVQSLGGLEPGDRFESLEHQRDALGVGQVTNVADAKRTLFRPLT